LLRLATIGAEKDIRSRDGENKDDRGSKNKGPAGFFLGGGNRGGRDRRGGD